MADSLLWTANNKADLRFWSKPLLFAYKIHGLYQIYKLGMKVLAKLCCSQSPLKSTDSLSGKITLEKCHHLVLCLKNLPHFMAYIKKKHLLQLFGVWFQNLQFDQCVLLWANTLQ